MFELNYYPRLVVSIELIILIVIVVWQLAVSVAIFWGFRYYSQLTRDVRRGNLINILDKVLKTEAKNKAEIGRLEEEINALSETGKLHIQKLGLVRFNPFKELGGDHSFVLALLDGMESGFIITGLHTRDRTRIYIKPVEKGGKPTQKLSTEEKKALKQALK